MMYLIVLFLTIGFKIAQLLSMVLMLVTLFCIFKNWNTGKNKELLNALSICTTMIIIISILPAMTTSAFYFHHIEWKEFMVPVIAICITVGIYLGAHAGGNQVYPDGYFEKISDSTFLKMELQAALSVIMEIFNHFNTKYSEYKEHRTKNHNVNANTHYPHQEYHERLNDNWSLLTFVIFNILTCGFYYWYFVYKASISVNIACDGDGEHTAGLLQLFLLTLITCGIYCIYWEYSLANRLALNGKRYGYNIQENGSSVLLWMIFGSLFCGIGYFISRNIILKNLNLICGAYNREHAANLY